MWLIEIDFGKFVLKKYIMYAKVIDEMLNQYDEFAKIIYKLTKKGADCI